MGDINFLYIIGQIFGVVAVLFGFLSYQMKTSKNIMIMQIATTVVFCIHYFLIGAVSGFALNIVCIVRNLVYANRDKKIFSYKFYPFLFAIITGAMGIASWQNGFSILIILGLIINAFGASFKNPQNIRKSILISSPLVLMYDIYTVSVGGAVYESIAIISSIIGILRYHKKSE